jgi:hypothetical protein
MNESNMNNKYNQRRVKTAIEGEFIEQMSTFD